MDPRVGLAFDALNRGNGQRALEHLATVQDLGDVLVWLARGQALRSLGRFDEAEDACRRGLALDPTAVQCEIELAGILHEQDRLAEAEARYISVLNRFPEHLPALGQYGWLLAWSGDAVGARQVLSRTPAVARATEPSLLALQGYVALIEGNEPEANRFLDRALALAPEASSLHVLRTLQAMIGPRPSEAREHMELAAALDPDGASALGREARFLRHPLLAPNRLADRVGPVQLWFVWLAVLYGLPRVWPSAPMGPIIVVWITIAVWSWVGPSILRRWLTFRGQL